jgi:ParB family transcriptional regulator, chromosome partitioning protein
MRDKQAEIDRLQQEIAEARANGSSVEVPLDRLVEVPGRRRFLSDEQKSELRENLRHNKLVHPIVVRPRPDGTFEVVSGHNRVDQYRELGREKIRAVAEESTDDEAAAGAFFANLMQSDLTDYEKYVGFKDMLSRHRDWTHAQISEQSGVSRGHVTALLAFDRLPPEALSIVQRNQAILGAKAALELAAIAEQGKAERVVLAVMQLADKKLDQAQAVKYARASASPTEPKPSAQSFKVKSGKSTWCDVRMAKNVMRIEFTSEDVAQSVREAIRLHLQTLAASTSTDEKL